MQMKANLAVLFLRKGTEIVELLYRFGIVLFSFVSFARNILLFK